MKRIDIRIYSLMLVILLMAPLSASERMVGILGTGYVGLTLGACLADFGNKVICADIDKEKIKMLNNGKIPIYEPGLEEMVTNLKDKGLLTFSDNPEEVIRNSEVIFIAVGTPMNEEGKADLSAVRTTAKGIGENLNGYKVICIKSTVPIGTGLEVKNIIKKYAQSEQFDVVSNPEFLKEGTAIHDFLFPDRVVIGSESEKALAIMREIYKPLIDRNVPFVYTDVPTSETIKYACNAFLAVKISFINEIANLCDETGADVKMVAKGMGYDNRIGPKFLSPGPGFGGSCFPKDVQALLYKGKTSSVDLRVVSAALKANSAQKVRVFQKLTCLLEHDFEKKTIGVLGLAFKANTDDVRYSPAITLIENLLNAGASVKAYDPAAIPTMKKIFPTIEYASSLYEAVTDVDAVVVLTEWDEFVKMDLEQVRSLVKTPILLDARNIISTKKLKKLGFSFDNIGKAQIG